MQEQDDTLEDCTFALIQVTKVDVISHLVLSV